MIAASLIMTRCTAPIDMLISTITKIGVVRGSFWRIEDLLNYQLKNHKSDISKNNESSANSENIVVHDVCVNINDKPILNKITFELRRGSVLGIIGQTGSGKTTLTTVLSGLTKYRGSVKYFGQELKNLQDSRLQDLIGYLPQRHGLFDGTIAENISGLEKPNSERVIEVANNTNIHEMILRLPQGYETYINSRDVFLSGGEIQRISMARAIYHNPECIILDEPNSALDKISEEYLANIIKNLKMKNKIVIVVTHRKGVLSMVDKILEIVDGNQVCFMGIQEYLGRFSKKKILTKNSHIRCYE